MPSTNDQIQAVLAALPADGSPILYDTLVSQLHTSGYSQAVNMLRGMKQRGEIRMSVRITDSGAVHEVSRA